jgi:anti-anti-sigma factor
VTDLELLKSQRLFPCRKLGDALIVQPQGALGGYGRTIIDADVSHLIQAARELDVRVVVLDLGSWNYFGSEMIGMFFYLRRAIPENVRMVICNASRDMRTILETMNVHQVIPIYATQKEALDDFARITIRDRLPSGRFLLPVVVVALILAVGVLGVMFAGKAFRQWTARLQESPEIETYQRLLALQNDLHRMRESEADSEDWAAFTSTVRGSVTRVIERERSDSADSQVSQMLNEAAQTLLTIVETDPAATIHDQELFESLSTACLLLEDHTGVELESPRIPDDGEGGE